MGKLLEAGADVDEKTEVSVHAQTSVSQTNALFASPEPHTVITTTTLTPIAIRTTSPIASRGFELGL